jgi:hypothetical protein
MSESDQILFMLNSYRNGKVLDHALQVIKSALEDGVKIYLYDADGSCVKLNKPFNKSFYYQIADVNE